MKPELFVVPSLQCLWENGKWMVGLFQEEVPFPTIGPKPPGAIFFAGIMKNTGKPGSHTVLKFDKYSSNDTTLTQWSEKFLAAAPFLILDVEGVNFDSRLIGELINLHRSFTKVWEDKPTRLALVNLSDFSKIVFDTVKLSNIIERYESVSEALQGP